MKIRNNTNSKLSIGSLNLGLDPFAFATIDTIRALGSEELQSFVKSGTITVVDFATGGSLMDTFISSGDDDSNVTGDMNFNEHQALNLRVENRTSDPAPGNVGRIFIRSDTGVLKYDDGTTIRTPNTSVGGGGNISGGPLNTGRLLVATGSVTIDSSPVSVDTHGYTFHQTGSGASSYLAVSSQPNTNTAAQIILTPGADNTSLSAVGQLITVGSAIDSNLPLDGLRWPSGPTATLAEVNQVILANTFNTFAGTIGSPAGIMIGTTGSANPSSIIFATGGLDAANERFRIDTPGNSTFRLGNTGGGPSFSIKDSAGSDLFTTNSVGKVSLGTRGTADGTLFTITANTTVSTTTATSSLLGSGVGNTILPANWFVAGKTLNIHLAGKQSSAASTPGTINIKFNLGFTQLATITTGTIPTGLNNTDWTIDLSATCQTEGSSGTLAVHGAFMPVWGSVQYFSLSNFPVTFATDASAAIDVEVTFSVGSSSNSITTSNGMITVNN